MNATPIFDGLTPDQAFLAFAAIDRDLNRARLQGLKPNSDLLETHQKLREMSKRGSDVVAPSPMTKER